jgi:uncharacterized repeat protein (TIGR03803 family)
MLNLPKYLERICRTTTALGIALAFTPGLHAQTQTWGLTNHYIFQGGISGTDGGTPYGGVIIGNDGNFYGTTLWGGGSNAYGIIFKVTPSGEETILGLWHDFFAHADRYRADSDGLWHAGRPVVCRWLGPLRNTAAQCARHLDRNNSERRRPRIGWSPFRQLLVAETLSTSPKSIECHPVFRHRSQCCSQQP